MEAPSSERAPATEAMMHMLRGGEAAIGWQYDQVPLHFERAGDRFEAIGDLRNACSQRLDAAIFLLDTADYERAKPCCVASPDLRAAGLPSLVQRGPPRLGEPAAADRSSRGVHRGGAEGARPVWGGRRSAGQRLGACRIGAALSFAS